VSERESILLTGGAGYIGSHVVKQLLQHTDSEIIIIDNLSTGFQNTIDTLKTLRPFKYIREDLSNWDAIDRLFQVYRFKKVIHFAASLIVSESVKNPLQYYLNNTANTANILKCCVKHAVHHFIFSSTAAIYGEPNNHPSTEGISETFPGKPINPYGQSKYFSEKMIQDTAKAYPLFKYVILRYFNVSGADWEGLIGQNTLNATHLMKVSAECALGKRTHMFLYGDNYPTPDHSCIRDYIHVDDLAYAHVKAVGYLEDHSSRIFNCGYGHGASVKDVIQTMKKISGVDFKVIVADRRLGDPAILIANNTKIKEEMTWAPKYDDLEYICKSTWEWEKKLC